jgi:hypothetical protein
LLFTISISCVQVLAAAEQAFAGTPQEITTLRMACEIAINKRDVGAALKRLRAVPRGSPLYRAARTAIADVSLRHRRDSRAYVAAHLDIVEVFKDYEAYVCAGDAFLAIQVRLQRGTLRLGLGTRCPHPPARPSPLIAR